MSIRLADIFSDGAVFQAGKPIRIFGEAHGEAMLIFDGETKKINTDGKFCVQFSARPYGGPYELSASADGEQKIYKNIYVGEVLLLAGQSNIAFKLKHSSYPRDSYTDEPRLRCFCGGLYETEHSFPPKDGWVACKKEETSADFSAIGYHIGQRLCKEKGIAVGLIACYLGSTVIESWIPAEIGNRPEFYLPPDEKYDSPYVRGAHNVYGTLYKLKQQPLVPFSVGNVIWYQGESNTGKGEYKNYTKLLCELIHCWRRDFCDPSLPFTVVQLADWEARDDEAWHSIQAAQEAITQFAENTAVVRSADLCETDDIHPPTKIRLAERIFENLKVRKLI